MKNKIKNIFKEIFMGTNNIPAVGGTGTVTSGNVMITGSQAGSVLTTASSGPQWMTMPSTYTYNTTGYTTVQSSNPASIITLFDTAHKEIVKLNHDGTVTWSPDVVVDDAAKLFGSMLNLSAEMRAGITKTVKCNIRDQVFEQIIEMAKSKGSLTVDDLTFMLESSKIIEKLTGTKD